MVRTWQLSKFVLTLMIVNLCLGTGLVYAADAPKPETTTPATSQDKKEYSGVYKGHQLVPNTMAIFCEMSGEEFLDYKKSSACFDKIVLKVHNENSSVSEQGKELLERMRFEWLKYMMADNTAKIGSLNDSEKIQETMAEDLAQAKTEHEDITGAATSNNYLAKTINNLQAIIAAETVYSGLEGMYYIDSEVLKEEAENSENKEDQESGNFGVGGDVIGATASKINDEEDYDEGDYEEDDSEDEDEDSKVIYLSDNKCLVKGEEKACPDGEVWTKDGQRMLCTDGFCALAVEDVVVTNGDLSSILDTDERPDESDNPNSTSNFNIFSFTQNVVSSLRGNNGDNGDSGDDGDNGSNDTPDAEENSDVSETPTTRGDPAMSNLKPSFNNPVTFSSDSVNTPKGELQGTIVKEDGPTRSDRTNPSANPTSLSSDRVGHTPSGTLQGTIVREDGPTRSDRKPSFNTITSNNIDNAKKEQQKEDDVKADKESKDTKPTVSGTGKSLGNAPISAGKKMLFNLKY